MTDDRRSVATASRSLLRATTSADLAASLADHLLDLLGAHRVQVHLDEEAPVTAGRTGTSEDGVRWRVEVLDAASSARGRIEVDSPGTPTDADRDVTAVLADVTAAVLEQQRLRRRGEARNQELDSVLVAVPCGVALCDRDGAFVYANAMASDLVRISTKEFLERPLGSVAWQMVDGEGRPMTASNTPAMTAIREDRPVQGVIMGIPYPEGHRWFLVNSVPLHDQGRVVGAASAFLDVTESREREADLDRTVRHLREAQVAARTGSFEYEPDTGNLWFSEALGALLEVEASHDTAGTLARLVARIHPDDVHLLQPAADEALTSGRSTRRLRLVMAPGTPRTAELVLHRQDRDDSLLLVGTLRDVTEELRVQDQLVQAQKMEGLGRLAAGLAHDLNNWLTVVLGHTELLAAAHGADDPDVAAVRLAGERAAELTNQVLAFARRTVMEPRRTEVRSLLHEFASLAGRVLPATITLEVDTDAEVADVQVDPARMQQVLLNLVINARDAIAEHGTIEVRAEPTVIGPDDPDRGDLIPGSYTTLVVRDDGCGMDADTLAHAMEPFFTTKPQGRGTGLGLSTAYGVIAQSGGRLVLTSEPGRGTRARLDLPVATGVAVRAAPRSPTSTPVGGSETVLVAEDDPQIRSLVEATLGTAGYEVVTAVDGADGLRRATSHARPIDVLVTDVVMPNLTGEELVARLRDLDPELPVLLMSGYTDRDLQGVAGPVRLLHKPFRPSELLLHVRGLLDRRPPGPDAALPRAGGT